MVRVARWRKSMLLGSTVFGGTVLGGTVLGGTDLCEMVAREGIEPPTRGFSVRCSTN